MWIQFPDWRTNSNSHIFMLHRFETSIGYKTIQFIPRCHHLRPYWYAYKHVHRITSRVKIVMDIGTSQQYLSTSSGDSLLWTAQPPRTHAARARDSTVPSAPGDVWPPAPAALSGQVRITRRPKRLVPQKQLAPCQQSLWLRDSKLPTLRTCVTGVHLQNLHMTTSPTTARMDPWLGVSREKNTWVPRGATDAITPPTWF